MQIIQRHIAVQPGTDITSVWAIPDHFAPGQIDAIILAHGAGNDMNHPFMSYFHEALAEAGLLSIKFNCPYTEQSRKAPDRPALLEQTWVAIANAVANDDNWRPRRLLLAGKSMGGRMASLAIAKGLPCAGLIFLGYPLHPPKQPDKIRTEHWPAIHCPALFLEGTRDALCNLELLKSLLPQLAGPLELKNIAGGDHSFKLPKSLGQDQDAIYAEMTQAILGWIGGLPNPRPST
jgi:predicted alpha/beta-hydrolase family hydrolase